MGNITIGCFPGLVSSWGYDFALKLADAAVTKGHTVSIWFSGNATGSIKAGQKHLKDYSTGEKHLKALMEKGVQICTCEACTVARGVQKADAIPGIQWNAMHWYLAKVHAADRVLLIGGE